MKKFLVVLLSLGLIVAFGAPASAATTVTFGGEYYIAGLYDSNRSVNDKTPQSAAFFWTRARMIPQFQVADGLKMTVQIDVLEKVWGRSDWRKGAVGVGADPSDTTGSVNANGNGSTAKMQESIDADRAFLDYNTSIGAVRIGYQGADVWGLDMNNTPSSRPRAQLAMPVGPITFMAIYEKFFETYGTAQTAGGVALNGKVDADMDTYALAGIYKGKGIEAGLLYKYYLGKIASVVPAAGGPYDMKVYLLSPYMKATFGPVYVEAELDYFFGKTKEYSGSTAGLNDMKTETLNFVVKGQFNMGPAYVGGLFAYATGNDPEDVNKATGQEKDKQFGAQQLARGWNGPGLMLGNDDLDGQGITYGAGAEGTTGTKKGSSKQNMWIGQIFAGYKATPKLEIWTGLLYAKAVKKPWSGATAATEFLSDNIGTEFDVTATYKIYDNLSYMVGAGYLWAGDWFKGSDTTFTVANDYLLMNKLTLSF